MEVLYGAIALAILILVYFTTRKKTVEPKVIYLPIEIVNAELNFEELILLGYINEYRKFKGLKTLKVEKLLCGLSREHVDYMTDKHKASHDNYNSRERKSGAKYFGENVAMRTFAPLEMFQAYLNSKDHRETIESPIYEWIGLSYKGRFNCCLFAKY